eukprot:6188393-Pleurochrysis_carterae.AAC.1
MPTPCAVGRRAGLGRAERYGGFVEELSHMVGCGHAGRVDRAVAAARPAAVLHLLAPARAPPAAAALHLPTPARAPSAPAVFRCQSSRAPRPRQWNALLHYWRAFSLCDTLNTSRERGLVTGLVFVIFATGLVFATGRQCTAIHHWQLSLSWRRLPL